LINLPEARRVADGCLFHLQRGVSCFIPKYAAYTELQLVQPSARVECHHLHDQTSGVTKLFAMLDCLFTNIAAGRRSRVSIVLCKTFAAVLLSRFGNVEEPVRVLFS